MIFINALSKEQKFKKVSRDMKNALNTSTCQVDIKLLWNILNPSVKYVWDTLHKNLPTHKTKEMQIGKLHLFWGRV